MSSPLLDHAGRVAIIHLTERTDRYRQLTRQLSRLGISINDPRVVVPDAPRPAELNGFPSKAVYGNFLSHLGILERALADGLEWTWVLEDDAIFRSHFESVREQELLCATLRRENWGMCFLGHALGRRLKGRPRGLIETDLAFIWAHCYLVHRSALTRLVDYLRETLERPSGHPAGGRLYIDGAFVMFRERNRDVRTLVANPALSIQCGSLSNVSGPSSFSRLIGMPTIVDHARGVRDEIWRWNGWHWPGTTVG